MEGKRLTLGKKLGIATLVGVAMSVSVFVGIFSVIYKNQLYSEYETVASRLNSVFSSLLKGAMLNSKKDHLNTIIQGMISRNQDMNGLSVLSRQGKVAFSNIDEKIGRTVTYPFEDQAKKPYVITQGAAGNTVLRKTDTLYTETGCERCHISQKIQPIRGYIVAEYDVSAVSNQVFSSSLLLLGSGALIGIINILGGLWFIRRFVLKPIGKISAASKHLTQGQLDTRVSVKGNDEFTDLATRFNQMGESLETKMRLLDESRNFLQNLIDTFPDGICVINQQFDIILSNQAYEQRYVTQAGKSKCYQRHFQQDNPCIPTLIACPLIETAEKDTRFKTIQQHKKIDGELCYVEVHAIPITVFIDGVEERLIIESIRDFDNEVQYSHETRLAEFGMLAYGVAHELLNPLSSIKFALYSCLKDMSSGSSLDAKDIRHNIELIDNEIGACIDITDKILKLSPSSTDKHELVWVGKAVQDTLSLLSWEATDKDIEIHYRLDDAFRTYTIIGSDSDLRVVVLNISQNAFHAMPEGGDLTVEIRADDKMVYLSFADTGIGISPEDIDSIFYPFFSKRADQSTGSGLGLAICKSIIDNYQGSLTVESVVGKGTTFFITIPRSEPEMADKELQT